MLFRSAISVAAYAHVADRYLLLDAGASFGDGYGPTVIVDPASPATRLEDLSRARIAVPGKWTSAYLALRMRIPSFEPIFADFKEVGRLVKEGTADAGLVIHEAQTIPEVGQIFTFHSYRFEILRKSKNRIALLKITALNKAKAGPTSEKT